MSDTRTRILGRHSYAGHIYHNWRSNLPLRLPYAQERTYVHVPTHEIAEYIAILTVYAILESVRKSYRINVVFSITQHSSWCV